jgi:hypothetical protein
MLSNMESDNRAELNEATRLAARARSAATTLPLTATVVLLVAEMALVVVIAFAGLSRQMAVVWVLFLAAFHFAVRSRRRARARRPWADPESRRLTRWSIIATLAINAVWIPLFFLARPVALALLFAGLVASLVSSIVVTRHVHA